MGVENLRSLAADEHAAHVDVSALSLDQATADAEEQRRLIAESDSKHVGAEREIIGTRAEIEQKFAEARDEIDARYESKVARAEEQRREQHTRNLEKREDAMGKVGLNPDGSNPHDRPRAVIDRDTRRVVDVKA